MTQRMHFFPHFGVRFFAAFCFAFGGTLVAENIMIQEENMKELNCSAPNDRFRLIGSNAPGQLFVGNEQVDVKLAFKKGDMNGRVPFLLEIQEVGTRTPGKVAGGMTGWTDTSGKAPLFDLIGTPVKHSFTVDFGNKDEIVVDLKNLPVSQRFGTYALILVRGGERQFLGTVAEGSKAASRWDNRQCADPWRGRFR
jgi:arginine/ornithine N-succinyltransferase beta subunit